MAIIILILSLLSFTYRATYNIDSDFGWHIRIGQIFFESGIPTTDPLSYTMPSYEYIQHEWLSNMLIAGVFPHIGMLGLALTFSLFAVGSILFQLNFRNKQYTTLILILIFSAFFPFTGVRTQQITWFFFSILLVALRNYDVLKNRIWFIVPMICLWTNLHGGFPIALTTLLIFFTARFINKKLTRTDVALFISSICVTLVNPYGYHLWEEVWMELSDTSLHWSIIEWMPTLLFLNIPMWMFFVVSITLSFRYRKHFDTYHQLLYIFLLISGLSTYRHMPLWMIFAVYPTINAFQKFYHEISKILYGSHRFNRFYQLLTAVALLSVVVQVYFYYIDKSNFIENQKYPQKAITYIKKHPPKGEIFSIYEWGGYLTWKLPEKKVFIDGKMPNWKRSKSPPNESTYAFKEYQKAMYGDRKEFFKVQKKYNIELVLVPKPKPLKKNEFDVRLERLILQFIAISPTKAKKKATDSMKKIYEDDVAIIYKSSSP